MKNFVPVGVGYVVGNIASSVAVVALKDHPTLAMVAGITVGIMVAVLVAGALS